MADDRRLIEDYLPIQAISAEASREKSVRKGHISTLHLWWARRPIVACRAAVYAALVPASQFVPNGASDEKKKSLGRANAAKFIERLCQYPGSADVIKEAQEHILKAHADRLSRETGKTVTVEDIVLGRSPHPKVLDMFAGGGAIPLEALRLGCEAHALDLNPVAYIIQLCTLVYPQRYGKPDTTVRGSGKDGTWAGLAAEIEHWGNWVLEKVKAEIGDLYPLIPDPEFDHNLAQKDAGGNAIFAEPQHMMPFAENNQLSLANQPRTFSKITSKGFLTPVAYLWTRTVPCKNPLCAATVPLVKQTWLCKKKDRYVAMRMVAPAGEKRARFDIIEATTQAGLGFDPEAFSKGGNAICPFCGTVADAAYVQSEGRAKRYGQQLMAIACVHPTRDGKVYISTDAFPCAQPDENQLLERIKKVESRSGIFAPRESINPMRPSPNARGISAVTRHGLTTFADLFAPRQLLCLLSFAEAIQAAGLEMRRTIGDSERSKSIVTFLGAILDRLADFNSSLCVLNYTGGRGVGHTFTRHALPMVWDFAETNPFNPDGASWVSGIDDVPKGIGEAMMSRAAEVKRGSATTLVFNDSSFDAVLTDPPYYDNVPYADISDFFYVWLRRTIGHLYPEHFASELTPKKAEATALASRHDGNMTAAEKEYERLMAQAFAEANRVLKPDGQMTVVYAHKTTLGWSTLVEALRRTGFTVTEAWPLDTEKQGRMLAQETAALASSIFLVARKREGAKTGSYEQEVRPELEQVVRERVETLWQMGITGADLIIAAVGAGLRAFTRFAHVEYANGEEVPAEKFLGEVESVVLETLLEKIFGVARSSVSAVDGPSRFYVLWRFAYRAAELEAGEAIVFTYGQPVELDGANGLANGVLALVEKKKGKYRLPDFTERGNLEKLGKPDDEGKPASLIDTLHRVLWLMENEPRKLPEFLDETRPDRERLRLVAQALGGAGLSGGSDDQATVLNTTPSEQAALTKLLANWRSLVPETLFTGTRR